MPSPGHKSASGIPFDPVPLYPALALIRIPADPTVMSSQPQPDDGFGTGFFVTSDGVLFTVAHNVTETGKPDGKPLPWLWVCTYSASTGGWTECHRVDLAPVLRDVRLDVALLQPSGVGPTQPLKLGAHWHPDGDAVVLGFQRDRKRKFSVRPLFCRVDPNWSVTPYDLRHGGGEPVLRLLPVTVLPGLLKRGVRGFSGGPLLHLHDGHAQAIGIEKAFKFASPETLETAEIRATAIHWVKAGPLNDDPRVCALELERDDPHPHFESACAAYRRRGQADWDRDFRAETDPPDLDRPPYVESQVLELLDELSDPRPHLSPERFRMRRAERGGPDRATRAYGGDDDKWKPIERRPWCSAWSRD